MKYFFLALYLLTPGCKGENASFTPQKCALACKHAGSMMKSAKLDECSCY